MRTALLALGVFLATVAVDFAWARYTVYVAEKRVHPAAFWSAIIILASALSVLAYTENRWMVLPAAVGAYVGTFIALKRGH